MKKAGFSLLLILICLVSGCSCKHEWRRPDCETPKTCSQCGETEGTAPGHSWEAASCETPERCSACAMTKGEPLGHSWQPADCKKPSQCATCGKQEGEALGHNMTTWEIKNTVMTRWCKNCTFNENITVDQEVIVRDHLLGTWSSSTKVRFNHKHERLTTPQADYSITFLEDGTLRYITDREYEGTWELDELYDFGRLDITLDCPELEDIYLFYAVVNGAGSLTVHEVHNENDQTLNYEYHRDTEEEVAQGTALLLNDWTFKALEINNTTYTDVEEAYSVRFLEDGTAELHLAEELNANWAYLVNHTRQEGHSFTYYRFGAFVPGETDSYIIHLYEDQMRIYVYQNETHYAHSHCIFYDVFCGIFKLCKQRKSKRNNDHPYYQHNA